MDEFDARVLVVDDELFFREAIVEILAADGRECIVCEDGESALEIASDPKIGVVVLDVRLPGIDGIEVLRRLRGMRSELRVIMLSSSTDQPLVLEALRSGACDYLAKPLHDEELCLAVSRALEGHTIASSWDSLRTRLDRMVETVQELSSRALIEEGERRSELLRQGAAQAASDILGAEKASMMLFTGEGNELEVVAAVGRELAPEEMDRVAIGDGVSGMVVQGRAPVLVGDVDSDERFDPANSLGRYATGSFAVAPLMAGGQSLGVLSVTDRTNGEVFSTEDMALLRLLSLQISDLLLLDELAASRAEAVDAQEELYDPDATMRALEVEEDSGPESDAELARLICDAVVSEVEPHRMIDAVLAPLVDALGAAPVSIFLLDGASGNLLLERENDGGVRAERQKIDSGRGLTGLVLQAGNIVATEYPAEDSRFDPEIDTPEGGDVAPMLCIPLRLRGKVFGVFRAFLRSQQAPSARTGEVLSAALSAAVRNVLLYRSLVDSIAEVAEARREASSSRRI